MDFKVQRNDITNMAVDAIVCPSNRKLKERTGTSTAIFEKAGRSKLTKACADRLKGSNDSASTIFPVIKTSKPPKKLPIGWSVVTSAYDLPSKIIIHTVVPKWKGGRRDEYQKLSESYLSALIVADLTSCTSIAMPLLATGSSGFNLDAAIEIAIRSIECFEPKNLLTDVYLVTYGSTATQKMRSLGFDVEEVIDERYVQEQDEKYKPAIVHAAEEAQDAVQSFVDQAVKSTDEMLKNETFQRTTRDVAVGIAVSVIGSRIPGVSALFKNGLPGL